MLTGFKQLRHCDHGDLIRRRDGKWAMVEKVYFREAELIGIQCVSDELSGTYDDDEWVLVVDVYEMDKWSLFDDMEYPQANEQEIK